MPGFPDEGIQLLFAGKSKEQALEEAYQFYKIVRRAGARYGLGWNPETRLLDFGVGWGRISRTFLKDIAPQNLTGVDVNAEILETCRSLMCYGTYLLCEIGKPLPLSDESFDVVVAFSVFSHLSESAHFHWIRELHRVLRRGGIVVLTTLARTFLNRCEEALHQGRDWFAMQIAELVSQGAVDGVRNSFQEFPVGRYFYLPTGGGLAGLEPINYGWAIISLEYAKHAWSNYFDIVEYDDSLSRISQAIFVLRKRSTFERLPKRSFRMILRSILKR